MQEFARVAEAAEACLLVVLADVRGEVCDCDCADVGWRFDRAHGFLVRVFGEKIVVGRAAFVVG